MQENNGPNCGREHDLLGFLYGELSDGEQQSFKSHMNDCGLCRSQINDFRSVRESIVTWRDESLNGAYAKLPATVPIAPAQKHSALAALRAFFDLSPLWMKGAVGSAALLFCMVTVLALNQWRSANRITPQASNNQEYSAAELNKIVEQRVHDEIERRTSSPAIDPTAPEPIVASQHKTVRIKPSAGPRTNSMVARNLQLQKAQRPLSRTERAQLAADLRLVSTSERSLNLLEDQINQ